jgi:hypothetical protein
LPGPAEGSVDSVVLIAAVLLKFVGVFNDIVELAVFGNVPR